MVLTRIIAIMALPVFLAACAETPAPVIPQVPAGVTLSPDDQIIWNSFTNAQKFAAIPYLQNGGTLVSSLGAN